LDRNEQLGSNRTAQLAGSVSASTKKLDRSQQHRTIVLSFKSVTSFSSGCAAVNRHWCAEFLCAPSGLNPCLTLPTKLAGSLSLVTQQAISALLSGVPTLLQPRLRRMHRQAWLKSVDLRTCLLSRSNPASRQKHRPRTYAIARPRSANGGKIRPPMCFGMRRRCRIGIASATSTNDCI